jgi:hypothetical protein
VEGGGRWREEEGGGWRDRKEGTGEDMSKGRDPLVVKRVDICPVLK